MADTIQVKVRIPTDLVEFLDGEARANRSSRNAELVRALRIRAGGLEGFDARLIPGVWYAARLLVNHLGAHAEKGAFSAHLSEQISCETEETEG